MNRARTDDRAGSDDVERAIEREPVELVARIEQLEREIEDLQSRYQQIRQSQYRGTALALGLIGMVSVGGAWAFPDSRQVLVALGGTGVFAAVLIYFLTPERFIAADVGESVYEALASNQAAIATELGLQDVRVYLPRTTGGADANPPVRLFVPQRRDYAVPPDDALANRFVVTTNDAERGMSFEPSASGLMAEFEPTLSSGLSGSPARLATQLIDGLENGFEIVDGVTPELSRADGRARFAVEGSAYGGPERFDNPVASFLAVGLASGLRTPVTASVAARNGAPSSDFIVTCEWSTEGQAAAD